MIRKLLVANRGEIAVRVMRTARELGIRTVAVYSDADRYARHVETADEAVHIGPSPATESYLNIPRIIEALKETSCDAVHPGYGFLSENPDFSEAVTTAGFMFVGPPSAAMRTLGNKIESRHLAQKIGVPVTPGATFDSPDATEVLKHAEAIGWPVLIKAAAGGGGKGMRVVRQAADLPQAIEGAMREAGSAFGDSTVYLEKYIGKPRHVEFQIFCDSHGNAVHLGERECSVQRRHQKIIEESPSVALTPDLRERMGDAAIRIVKEAGYINAGTVEFLLDGDEFYFLEVNARLQVEHPVTEFVTGEDLVAWQLCVASGETLPKTQNEISFRGHSVECRIYAEDPANGFLPSSGKIQVLEEPHMPGIRIDSGIREGADVPVYYDPILAKVISYGVDRAAALRRIRSALTNYVLLGVATPIELLQDVLRHPEFQAGNLSTHFLDDYLPNWKPNPLEGEELAAMLLVAARAPRVAAPLPYGQQAGIPSLWSSIGAWHIAGEGNR